MRLRVTNTTRDVEVASRADIAGTSRQRRDGLLKRSGLEPGEGLWIIPCEAVHCFFMKFAIDVLFLDKNHKVVKATHELKPWRIAGSLRAHSVLELPAGQIRATGTQAGDQLALEEYDEALRE